MHGIQRALDDTPDEPGRFRPFFERHRGAIQDPANQESRGHDANETH